MRKGNRILSVLLVCCIMLGILPATAFAASAESIDGFIAPIEAPDASATQISTAAELAAIANDLTGSYVLTNDIDLSNYGTWHPIGTTLSNAFRGKLDGQGYKITGLTVSSVFTSATLAPVPPYAVGLFGVCDGAQIKNLELEDISVSVKNSSGYQYEATKINGVYVYAGGIAGYATNETVIYNCHSSGAVIAAASGEAQSRTHAGGLIGSAENTIISYSYNEGTVNTSYQSSMFGNNSYAGGLIGYCKSEVLIDRSYNSGTVTAAVGDYTDAFSGGLIGGVDSSAYVSITNCFNEGAITTQTGASIFGGEDAYSGGIAGTFSGSIDCTYNSGTVAATVKDSLGIATGSAYAGGICGNSTDGSSISNSASIQSQVAAQKGKFGTQNQYRISYGGTKSNNVTISTVTSGSTNDADIVKATEDMKVSTVYENTLGWDFSTVWEMATGKDFPQLKQVDVESEEYTNEYIEQHLNFINGTMYNDLLTNYRWAQIYWSAENNFKSNAGEALYRVIDGVIDVATLDFGALFEDGNPYKIIVLDYISDQSTVEDVTSLYKVTVPYSLDTTYQKVESFIKENWEDAWGDLSDEDIFWLLHYSERPSENWITSDFEEHIDEIVYGSQNSKLAEALSISDETLNSVINAKQKYYDSIIDWFNGFIDYSANVSAYISADQEFKTVLETIRENIPDTDPVQKAMLDSAIKSYTQYETAEDLTARLFADYIADTAVEKFSDVVVDYIQKGIKKWMEATFSIEALNQLEIMSWAADVTWKICDYVTKNGELMDCRQMLRSNAFFESAVFSALKVIESDFISNQTIENARLFDAAFRFFKETQIYSMDICITYFDTYQTALLPAIRNLSNTFMNSAIEEVQINKLFLYTTYCHGTTYRLGGKLITIACPTDVMLYDENSNLVLEIVNDQVIYCASGIFASSISNVKTIALPIDQNYTIDIRATDDGFMDYIVSEYSANMENVQNVVYSDIVLTKGTSFSGTINNVLKTEPSNYDLTGSDSQVIDNREVISEDSVVPVSQVSIGTNEVEMAVNETISLSASVSPDNATVQSLVWLSSDPRIATVSEDGEVTALSNGTTEIYAQAVYGGVSDVCSVTVQPNSTSVTGVTLHKTNITLTALGAAEALTATVTPDNATNKSVTWTSSDSSIATVDCNGVVTAVANGTTAITVATEDGGYTATCIVTVNIPAASISVTDVAMNKTNMTLDTIGATETLTVTITPDNATNKGVTWTSSDESVATVNGSGLVTAVGEGMAIITATTSDGSFTATCKVTVRDSTSPTPQNYTVTFDPNGGTVTPVSAVTNENGKLTALPIPIRSGYAFNGWYTASIGGSKVTGDTVFTANTTVYAQWSKENSGSSSSSGSGSAPTNSYTISAPTVENGTISVSPESASEGTAVTITVTPDEGYELDGLNVTDAKGNELTLTDKGNSRYTFTMPASKVNINVSFAEIDDDNDTVTNPFTDVSEGSYYYDAVLWAVEQGITIGTSATTFSPDASCTRAQAVTFLWRAAGSPAPKSSTMPFADVAADAYYHDAVLWAVENGITKGTNDTTFSPDDDCTRAQIVTFLWRSQGTPTAGTVNPFADVAVDTYYTDAVLWAVKSGITEGTSATTFSPNDDCTRAQIVTFLYRCMNK